MINIFCMERLDVAHFCKIVPTPSGFSQKLTRLLGLSFAWSKAWAAYFDSSLHLVGIHPTCL